ncbi:response regulator [Desulfoferrobacter suflitae]|uniref:response regulator n=1 Tax=Desulfoferrobacter suflitae TaxID=2865782 RepID=UPI0021642002|nr:response regulator [Desulfoferrobacter suflitae]MCK8603631.1 response regulator [Desulfoferrobacter suflitae]
MLHILLATTRLAAEHPFVAALTAAPQVRLTRTASAAEVLKAVRQSAPHLIILDHQLPDGDPLELVAKILTLNAMINSAVVSPLSDEEFHEASEGLGILARLPLDPGKDDAVELVGRLRRILGLAS